MSHSSNNSPVPEDWVKGKSNHGGIMQYWLLLDTYTHSMRGEWHDNHYDYPTRRGCSADVIGRLLMSVYEIHERIIARGGGGLEGIREAGLLHAAVARPFATFGAVELYPIL